MWVAIKLYSNFQTSNLYSQPWNDLGQRKSFAAAYRHMEDLFMFPTLQVTRFTEFKKKSDSQVTD